MDNTCVKISTEIVVNAIEKASGGDKSYLDAVVNRVNDPGVSPNELLKFLNGLRRSVTYLDKRFEELVGFVLKMKWAAREEQVAMAYQSFLLNLISAQTIFLRPCLRSMVKLLCPFVLESECETMNLTEFAKENQMISKNVHLVLQPIIKLVPMCPELLIQLMRDIFPYQTLAVHSQEWYIRNMLILSSYLHGKRSKVLEIIVDKMVKIDVRSPREEIESAEDESDIFHLDDDLIAETDMMVKIVLEKPMAHSYANKLDVMMHIYLRYIHDVCFMDGKLNWESTKKLYQDLISVFDSIILPTQGSTHVQYLIFYLCSFRKQLVDGFTNHLWKKVKDPCVDVVYRRTAASYIASFLARASFVDIVTVKTTLELFCKWLHKYEEVSSYSTQQDITRHATFYSVCQSVMYIISFRSKDLFERKADVRWAESLNIQRIVVSRMNPLNFCLPIIVKTFSSVCRMHQLAFCDTVIERNNRLRLPLVQDGPSAISNHSTNNIDVFKSWFPFDPYLLTRSAEFIHPLYREYSGLVDDNDTEEELFQSSDYELNDHSENGMEIEIPSNSCGDKKKLDLMKYGTSPGFMSL